MANTQTFAAGDEVYDIDGRVAQYVSAHPSGGHIVMPIYENGDEEFDYGEPTVWSKAWTTPPRDKLAGDLKELHDNLDVARAALATIAEEKRGLESSMVSLRKHAKDNPELAPLAMWLDGEAKFAVVLGGDYGNQFNPTAAVMGPTPEVFRKHGEYASERKIRLVSLFWEPEAERTFKVRIARYEDGSGDKTGRVFLGRTQQEALDAAAAHVTYQQKIGGQNEHTYAEIGQWLAHFGYDESIEPRARAAMAEANERGRKNLAKAAADELARAEAALAAARLKFDQTQQAVEAAGAA